MVVALTSFKAKHPISRPLKVFAREGMVMSKVVFFDGAETDDFEDTLSPGVVVSYTCN